MKWDFSSPVKYFTGFCTLSVFLACSILIFSCCQSGDKPQGTSGPVLPPSQTETAENWIDLQIKFKPNSSKEMRDASVMAIEQMLIDTIAEMRKGRYPNYSPEIITKKTPLKDSNLMELMIRNVQFGPHPDSTTILPPKCVCATCKICNIISLNPPGNAVESITPVN